MATQKKGLIDFYAQCRCGWKYGPGLQVDVLEQAKHHRKTCGTEDDPRRLAYANHYVGAAHLCPLCADSEHTRKGA